MKSEQELLCALSNGDIANDLERPQSPQINPILRFGSSFISLERLKLESSNFVQCRSHEVYQPRDDNLTNDHQMGVVSLMWTISTAQKRRNGLLDIYANDPVMAVCPVQVKTAEQNQHANGWWTLTPKIMTKFQWDHHNGSTKYT